MANRVSNDQLEELLQFLAEHPTVARGVGLGSRSKESIENQWNDLARKLNSFGSGSSKTGDRWKKYWADLKHKTKSRLAKRREEARGTGGGPSIQGELSEIDKKVLAIIGEQAVYGDTQHRVPVLNIQPEVQISVTPDHMIFNDVVISNTSEYFEPVAGSVEQVPESQQTGLESPVIQSRFVRSRPRLRHTRNRHRVNTNNTTTSLPRRVNPEWVKELERSRVQAENKMADASSKIAEAANKIAEASLMNAQTNRMNVETNRINAETSRMQLEIMRAINQSCSALAARNTH